MSDRKAVIKNADMSEDVQQDAVEVSAWLDRYSTIDTIYNTL